MAHNSSQTRRPSQRHRRSSGPKGRNRWLDFACLVIETLTESRWTKRLPTRLRHDLYVLLEYLYQAREVKNWLQAGGSPYGDKVQEDVHVTLPAIWVAEYFPPSVVSSLNRAIRKNYWDHNDFFKEQTSHESISAARRGSMQSWIIAQIEQESDGKISSDTRFDLPKVFESVELRGVPVGEGITAVAAHFELTEIASHLIDVALHAPHGPSLTRIKGYPARAETEYMSVMRETQRARSELHEQARTWLASHFPGVFSRSSHPHPSMDLLLLNKSADFRTLMALGVGDWGDYGLIGAPELPGLYFDESPHEFLGRKPSSGLPPGTMSFWGTLEPDPQDSWGTPQRIYMNLMPENIVRFGIDRFLDLLTDESATMRDTATARHGRFRRRDLQKLRQRFLTSSLDYSSIERDIRIYTKVASQIAPRLRYRQSSSKELVAFTTGTLFLKLDDKRQIKKAQNLVAFDREYREILSTVASLGASIDSYKVQRYAIWIAVASVLVAVVTLWVSMVGLSGMNDILRFFTHSPRE